MLHFFNAIICLYSAIVFEHSLEQYTDCLVNANKTVNNTKKVNIPKNLVLDTLSTFNELKHVYETENSTIGGNDSGSHINFPHGKIIPGNPHLYDVIQDNSTRLGKLIKRSSHCPACDMLMKLLLQIVDSIVTQSENLEVSEEKMTAFKEAFLENINILSADDCGKHFSDQMEADPKFGSELKEVLGTATICLINGKAFEEGYAPSSDCTVIPEVEGLLKLPEFKTKKIFCAGAKSFLFPMEAQESTIPSTTITSEFSARSYATRSNTLNLWDAANILQMLLLAL